MDARYTNLIAKSNLHRNNIKQYVEASFRLDFNLINAYEFFVQLKPKLRHKLVNECFGEFRDSFHHMFNDDDFVAGNEFMAEFLSSLYCRIYIPKSEIIKYGETFPELYLIHRGIVVLSLKGGGKENEFFCLPSYSYFGDY